MPSNAFNYRQQGILRCSGVFRRPLQDAAALIGAWCRDAIGLTLIRTQRYLRIL